MKFIPLGFLFDSYTLYWPTEPTVSARCQQCPVIYWILAHFFLDRRFSYLHIPHCPLSTFLVLLRTPQSAKTKVFSQDSSSFSAFLTPKTKAKAQSLSDDLVLQSSDISHIWEHYLSILILNLRTIKLPFPLSSWLWHRFSLFQMTLFKTNHKSILLSPAPRYTPASVFY